jgi:hypothetical protein
MPACLPTNLVSRTTAAHRLILLWASAQGFLFPSTPPGILWSDNQTLAGLAGTTTGMATDCVDMTNGSQPGGVGTMTPTYCMGTGHFSLSNILQTITDINHASNRTTTNLSSLTGPYSISTQISLTMSNGANMLFADIQTLSPIPELASITLLGGVLLLTGLAPEEEEPGLSLALALSKIERPRLRAKTAGLPQACGNPALFCLLILLGDRASQQINTTPPRS